MFQGGVFPYFHANCTSDKKWNPTDEIPGCGPRECESEPPLPYMLMTRDWRLKSRTLGSRISYDCPHMIAATEQKVITQYVQCVLDRETDRMMWYPHDIQPCTGKCLLLMASNFLFFCPIAYIGLETNSVSLKYKHQTLSIRIRLGEFC